MCAFRAPKRGLGQNFLVDPNLQRKIVERLDIKSGDLVVEIGPGRGALTHGLLDRATSLVLVEKDDDLAAHWIETTRRLDHVRVVHADILEVPLDTLGPTTRMRVVGNIPYNITAPILFHVLTQPRPQDVVVMVQREVAARILAAPGTREYGALTVGLRSVARAERLLNVPRTAFSPRPNVDSTVVRIVPLRPATLSGDMEEALRRVTRAAFGWRRKKLRTVLRDHPEFQLSAEQAEAVLKGVDIDPNARGETLDPERFIRLAQALT